MKKVVMTWCFVVAVIAVPKIAGSAIDNYEFSNEESRTRFQRLTADLRCPKCQNQNIADSAAPIAKDLRGEIHRMLEENRSNDEIVDFMVERYGDFVLYKPRLNTKTFLLWFGPGALLILGLIVAVTISRRSMRVQQPTELTQEEQRRLEKLLDRHEGDRR